ncbi:MAG: 1-phosphofructokinase family hexose kinase, partial [Lacrimispora sphenoides]
MIITVTLNASVDKAYTISGSVEPGTVMRVIGCRNSAGGKGLNVARVANLCKVPVKATGIVGGYNGDYLLELLKQDGVAHDFFHVVGETRSCINILTEDNTSTEFLEPGFEVTEAEQREFLNFFRNVIQEGSIVTISGSVPVGFG